MKCTIEITGQMGGNYTLGRAIGGQQSNGMFHAIICRFDTKKEAYEALKEAYKTLKRQEPEFVGRHLYGAKSHLRYDASIAKIYTETIN
jgi:hypothetical protein